MNHNDLGGVVLAEPSVERFDAEFRVTLLSQLAIEGFDPLTKGGTLILRLINVVMVMVLEEEVRDQIFTPLQFSRIPSK